MHNMFVMLGIILLDSNSHRMQIMMITTIKKMKTCLLDNHWILKI